MFKRVTRGWLARAGIASALGAAAIFAAVTLMGPGTAKANPGDIQWVVSGPTVVTVGNSFSVNLNATDSTAVTWGGWNMETAYNTSILASSGVTNGGLCPAANWASPPTPPGIWQSFCTFQTSTASSPPPTETIGFTCTNPGTALIHLVTLAQDPVQGSTFFDPNAVNIPTDLTDLTVQCVLGVQKSDNTGGTAIAGSSHTYTIHVNSPGAVSSPDPIFGGTPHTLSDTVPAPLVVTGVTSTNGASDGCSFAANVVTCSTLTANAVTGTDVTITFDVPLSAAGTNNVCNTAKLDGVQNTNTDCFNVAPASLSVTKVANAASYQAGDPISWTITVTSNGPSPAGSVQLTDTPTDGWTASSPTTNNFGDMAPSTSATFVVSGTVNATPPTDATCNNSVSVASNNGASASASAQVSCLSKNVRMVKSDNGVTAPTTSGELVNLFLNKSCGSPAGTALCPITIYEWALNVNGDPDGVGAFEFQVKYDNHIFDISIAATNWLYATGRVPGATGIGGCAATIITENDIRFGCVSKNPVDGSGNPIVTTGNKTNGVIATITVTPKADLVNRITPGNDNGAIRSLLDEGCEFADIWGHPLSTNQLDALGREILLPGVGPGGVITDCADVTITVRILEGDMNLDCQVTVADDQIEASHYGAMFGNLLYQPWYDLEPWLKDGDVDIKDLQKVFGRNGSNCTNPVPAQPPLPEPVDP